MIESNTERNNYSNNTIKVRDGLIFFGIGATIGATLALLFAPKPGTELRSDIADATRKSYDATVDKATELKDQSLVAVQAVKDKASAVYNIATAKLNENVAIVEDVVSGVSGAVNDGIERMQNESGNSATGRTSGRRSSNVM